MIVNLNVWGRNIVIIGGGNQAQKRINRLIGCNTHITVISESVNSQLNRLVKSKKITLIKRRVADVKFISEIKPDIIITTTNDAQLNQKILNAAKRKKIIVYSADNPEDSDFSNLAVIDFEGGIKVAIYTGGKSPAMAKKIKSKVQGALKGIITKQDILHVQIQEMVRDIIRETTLTAQERKRCLEEIMSNGTIDQLIKAGKMSQAKKQARTILRKWR